MPLRYRRAGHVAFFIAEGFADTVPTLSVVSTLVRRGYRVSYVTKERFESELSGLGAQVIRYRSSCTAAERAAVGDAQPPEAVYASTVQLVQDVTPFYEENRPDLIIHDTVSLAGVILAKKWGISTIQVSCDFRMDRQSPSREAPEFFAQVLDIAKPMAQTLERYGVASDSHCFSRGALNVYFYPKAFQLDGETGEENDFYAGRCAPERPHTERWRPGNDANRPVVMVSTSTLFSQRPNYYRRCIEALVDLHWHVVLQIGDNNRLEDFTDLPANVEVIQRKPQIAILPYVDLLICAGGMMTAVEAAYCGVPLVMMTNGNVELEAYAENNVRLGLGRHLKGGDVSVEQMRETVKQVTDDAVLRGKVKRLQSAVRAAPGAEEVANLVDARLASAIGDGKLREEVHSAIR